MARCWERADARSRSVFNCCSRENARSRAAFKDCSRAEAVSKSVLSCCSRAAAFSRSVFSCVSRADAFSNSVFNCCSRAVARPALIASCTRHCSFSASHVPHDALPCSSVDSVWLKRIPLVQVQSQLGFVVVSTHSTEGVAPIVTLVFFCCIIRECRVAHHCHTCTNYLQIRACRCRVAWSPQLAGPCSRAHLRIG